MLPKFKAITALALTNETNDRLMIGEIMKIYKTAIFSLVLFSILMPSLLWSAEKKQVKGITHKNSVTVVQAPILNKKLFVVVEQDYGTQGVTLPVEEQLKQLIESAGLSFTEDNEKYDAALRISIKGQPIREDYQKVGNYSDRRAFYTSAQLTLVIQFEDSASQTYKKTLMGKGDTPTYNVSFEKEFTNAAQAPFANALLKTNFYKELADIINNNYGSEAAIGFWLGTVRYLSQLPKEIVLKERHLLYVAAGDAIPPLYKTHSFDLLNKALRQDNNLDVRAVVASALSKIDTPQTAAAVISALKDEHLSVTLQNKNISIIGTAKFDNPEVIHLWTNVFIRGKQDEYFREVAISALINSAANPVVLKSMITTKDPRVRAALTDLISRRKRQAVLWALIELLKDENATVSQRSLTLLKDITNQDFGTDLLQWKQWLNENSQKLMYY